MQATEDNQTSTADACGQTRRWAWVSVGLAALLSGCGNIPNATVSYYLAESSVSIKVIRSVMCDKGKHPVVATTVTPTVVHRADPESAKVFDIGAFRGSWSDADVKVELFEDGRLKSLNASTTGQGEAILKAVSTLLVQATKVTPKKRPDSFPEECAFLETQNPGKPITIVYEGPLDPMSGDTPQYIGPETASSFYHRKVATAIGSICAVASKTQKLNPPAAAASGVYEHVLHARQPGWVSVDVWAVFANGTCTPTNPALWSGRISIAQAGTRYTIPVPRPAVFGKQTMGVVFAESGALSSLQYTSTAGAAQALGGLNPLLSAAQGDTTAQKALQVKAEADLIAAQQRLVLCQADPDKCK